VSTLRSALYGTAIVIALSLAACFGGGTPEPRQRYYTIASALAEETKPATDLRIALEGVDARGVYAERPLLHRNSGDAAPLEQYDYASWAEPPDVMLEQALFADLGAAFGATRISRVPVRSAVDLRVAVRLQGLEQVIGGTHAQAHFAAVYTVTDAAGEPLLVYRYDRLGDAAGPSPLEFVRALGGLVADADRRLIDQLKTLPRQKREAGP
jgi:uncharacterized lipoprotein YmbA